MAGNDDWAQFSNTGTEAKVSLIDKITNLSKF